MKRPFDFIGKELIDLNNEAHRKVVLKRNKDLAKAIKRGLELFDIEISISCEATCLKCGGHLESVASFGFDDFGDYEDMTEAIPSMKCGICLTVYKYNITEQSFFPRMPSFGKLVKKKANLKKQ